MSLSNIIRSTPQKNRHMLKWMIELEVNAGRIDGEEYFQLEKLIKYHE